jgi:hypothetical protein
MLARVEGQERGAGRDSNGHGQGLVAAGRAPSGDRPSTALPRLHDGVDSHAGHDQQAVDMVQGFLAAGLDELASLASSFHHGGPD